MKSSFAILIVVLAACAPAASPSPSAPPSPTAMPTASPSPTPIPTPEAHAITVSLDLKDPDAWPEGTLECEGIGGFDDISQVSQVVVRDGAGVILATADLGIGLQILADTCSFIVKVENVPVAAFYSIEISHRGELVYSAAEMEQKGWHVNLTLGD